MFLAFFRDEVIVLFHKLFDLLFDLINFVIRQFKEHLHLIGDDLGVVRVNVVFKVNFVLFLAEPELDRKIEDFRLLRFLLFLGSFYGLFIFLLQITLSYFLFCAFGLIFRTRHVIFGDSFGSLHVATQTLSLFGLLHLQRLKILGLTDLIKRFWIGQDFISVFFGFRTLF